MQTSQGNWMGNEFQTAAYAIYAIRKYTPIGHSASGEDAIARAVQWLEKSRPRSTNDRVLRTLALTWAEDCCDGTRRAARAFAGTQR